MQNVPKEIEHIQSSDNSFYECLKLKSSIQDKINNGLLSSLLFAKKRIDF